MSPRLELLEPIRERLAGEVRAGTRDLDQRELERQPGVAALAHVLDCDREQIDEPDHRCLAELIRLCAEALSRLLGDRECLRHLAHVLDEHEVTQVLQQVDDEAAEILALLRELLEERERPGRVAVDDEVAEAEERLLLDGTEQLQHRLHADVVLRGRCELIECRDGVAERPARAASDERERRSGTWMPSPSATRRR